VKCQDSGVLTDPKVCEPVKCGKPPSVPKSRPGIAGDVFFGQNLVYSCDVGYTLTGTPQGATEFQRDCKKDGAFSSISSGQPCKGISPGNAPTITNAMMTEYAGLHACDPRDTSCVTVCDPRDTSCVAGFFFPPRVSYPNGLEYKCNQGYSSTGSPSGPTMITARVNSIGQFTPALPTACKVITYTVRGQVKNARSGAPLNGATVRVETVCDPRDTSCVPSFTSNKATVQSGFFTLTNLKLGSVNIVYEMSGFIKTKVGLAITGNVNSGGVADVIMSPAMKDNEWRAVLTWGPKTKSDLDTYATWGRKKVNYQKKKVSGGRKGPKVELEVDSGGAGVPETLYFSKMGKCRGACDITYKINDYSKRGTMLSLGDAEVTLYTGTKAAGTWKIKDCPRSVYNKGNWWSVFTLDARTNKLKWTCKDGPKKEGALTTERDARVLDYNHNNQNVYMQGRHGGKNQQWYFDRKKRLKTKYDGKCLDYNYGNKNVYMGKCHGGKNQKWRFDSKGRLKTKYDSKCLDYNPTNKNIYMSKCHGGKNQKWYFD